MIDKPNIDDTTTHLFRHESGKMLAVLLRFFGLPQSQIAEDIVQDTLLTALETWKLNGMPEQPRAWLYRTAKNKTIDFLRRERNFRDKIAPNIQSDILGSLDANAWLDPHFSDAEIEDAQLRTMFACCHPAIPVEAQLVLILRILCGLSTREIAAALLLPEDSVGKRLYRAKEKIRQERLSLDAPIGADLPARLDAVLQAVYLLFNEGYKSSSDAAVIRLELCEEALRLGGLMAHHAHSSLPKTHALQALMCFHAARLNTRLDAQGNIVLLEHQDRSQWNVSLIAVGYAHFQKSHQGKELSAYHLEAAIASYHASAPVFEKTNWKAIFHCYDLLLKLAPSPFVALNRAIALGYAEGPVQGIQSLLRVEGLSQHPLLYAALGDFYKKNCDLKAAAQSYRTALGYDMLPAERKLLEQKLVECQ
jgi:RNA polymerase sigma factor (sigma-70 family)